MNQLHFNVIETQKVGELRSGLKFSEGKVDLLDRSTPVLCLGLSEQHSYSSVPETRLVFH